MKLIRYIWKRLIARSIELFGTECVNRLIRAIISLSLLFSSTLVGALDSDSEQPIYIDSNTATYDDKAQTSVYTGNVVTIQGSLRVDSDKLVVYLKNGAIDKLIATGEPAKFEQLPAKGKEKIKGEALIGEYYPEKNLLILKKQAVVWQGGNKSASELIHYDSRNALIKAGEKSSDSKRVHSVFKPKPKQQSDQ